MSISFSRVEGSADISGSGGIFPFNDFCGGISIGGSDVAALDNTGLAPLEPLPDC